MGFVRILQPVSPQLIKISKKTHYPSKIFSIGHCLIFKHYAINWESFQKTQAIKVSTPLLTVYCLLESVQSAIINCLSRLISQQLKRRL